MKDFQFIILLSICVALTSAQNPCQGVWAGRRAHPDCGKYYNCVLTIPIEASCGSNQIFDPQALACIPGDPETCEPFVATTWPSSNTTVFTPTPPSESTTSTQPVTTTLRTTTPPPNFNQICRNVFFGAQPYPNSDTLFVGCIRGEGLVFQCFEDEIFDRSINECVQKCEVSSSVCTGSQLQVVKNPCDCSRYLVCFGGSIIADEQCDENKIFNPTELECAPGNSETCELYSQNTAPLTEPTFPAMTTPSFNDPCADILFGSVAHEADCTMFYRCVNYVAVPSQCPPGMHFDRLVLDCANGSC